MPKVPDLFHRIEKNCPAFQARVAARALTRYYNACFRPLDLTAEQFSLLVGISSGGESTVAELAARAGVDATTLSRNVQTLERRGLVLSQGGRGRSGKRLSLTQNGDVLLNEAATIWDQARESLTKIIGPQSAAESALLMARLSSAAQQAIAKLSGQAEGSSDSG